MTRYSKRILPFAAIFMVSSLGITSEAWAVHTPSYKDPKANQSYPAGNIPIDWMVTWIAGTDQPITGVDFTVVVKSPGQLPMTRYPTFTSLNTGAPNNHTLTQMGYISVTLPNPVPPGTTYTVTATYTDNLGIKRTSEVVVVLQ